MSKMSMLDKRIRDLMGLSIDEAREYILKFAKGAEETSSMIKFIYRKQKWELFFEDGICKSAEVDLRS